MPQFLDTRDPDFEPRFAALLGAEARGRRRRRRRGRRDPRRRGGARRRRGDRDDRALGPAAADPRDPRLLRGRDRRRRRRASTRRTARRSSSPPARIRAYHERQLPADARWTDAAGAELGWRWTPVAAAGLYVPGGLASYPSSLLMNAIPARVAGVERLVVCAPTPGRRGQPAGAARRAARRRRHRLPHRRRPGDRRARLRHRDDRRRSTRSPAPATPGSPRPSGGSSAGSAST